jgi:hypothetical protein
MIDAEEHVYDDDPRIGHPDVRTLLRDVSYFFLGNGRMQAAVQFAPSGEGTPVGLLVMDPERLGKKREALSFDPETGLEATMVRIRARGAELVPSGRDMDAAWSLRRGVPAAVVKWRAGGIDVAEEFFCPDPEEPVLARVVTLNNRSGQHESISLETGLGKMTAARKLELKPGACASTYILYHTSSDRQSVSFRLEEEVPIHPNARAYWAHTARAHFDSPILDRYFDAARFQLPAVVSAAGRADASIWQYNREWVRDHAWIAVGLVLSGQHEKAGTLLRRLLREFVTDKGDTIDSSEQRHPDEVELDQNGELLYALDQYTRWTGDPGIVRDHWGKVEALAEFPLQDLFRHPASGLLANWASNPPPAWPGSWVGSPRQAAGPGNPNAFTGPFLRTPSMALWKRAGSANGEGCREKYARRSVPYPTPRPPFLLRSVSSMPAPAWPSIRWRGWKCSGTRPGKEVDTAAITAVPSPMPGAPGRFPPCSWPAPARKPAAMTGSGGFCTGWIRCPAHAPAPGSSSTGSPMPLPSRR